MVGYMSLEEQVEADFARARRRALLRRLGARLRKDRGSDRLPCFEDARRRVSARGGARLERRVVRSEDVVGSVGRCSDFDRAFLPAEASVGTRWKRMDEMFHRAEEFPHVSLYKVGDAYFVVDGNHRVSVYRYHGVEWVDAYVTEFRAGLWSERGDEGNLIEPPEGGEPKLHEMMDFEIWRQRREEMMREAERNRLAKALRDSRKQRGSGRASSLAWELKRIAGRLLKLLRLLRKID